jgi:hypothetical protein
MVLALKVNMLYVSDLPIREGDQMLVGVKTVSDVILLIIASISAIIYVLER